MLALSPHDVSKTQLLVATHSPEFNGAGRLVPEAIRCRITIESVEYVGIYDDGWVEKDARVVLPGGEAGHLVIRAHVLPHGEQHLEVVLNGKQVVAQSVEEGPLDLRIPVPASRADRRIELRWAGTTQLSSADPRQAAAQLLFLDVTPPPREAPTALRVPAGLANPEIDYAGISRDGWLGQDAHVVLAGGPAADLVVRGRVSTVRPQQIEVTVDGSHVASEDITEDALNLRIAIPASDSNRLIELHWAQTGQISADDPRQAAAHLAFIGVTTGSPPALIRRFPSDLLNPNLAYSGISLDGWVEKDASVVLVAGAAGDLVIRGRSSASPQGVEVVVDGEVVASEQFLAETVDLRVTIPVSDGDRRIELHWSNTAPVSDSDPREVAAHLDLLGVTTGGAPALLRRFPTDLFDPNLVYSGILADGWVEQEAELVLAGGPAGELVVRGQLLEIESQQLDVLVDGHSVASEPLSGDVLDVRIPIPAADSDRHVALHWAHAAPVSPSDSRHAAAHLTMLAVTRGRRE